MNIISKKFLLILLFVFLLSTGATIGYKVYASIVGRPVPTASPVTVNYGGQSTISWGPITADGCGIIAPSSYIGRGGNGTSGSFLSDPLYVNTTFTVRCAIADTPPVQTCTPVGTSYSYPISACFTADTKVDMADGTTKNIQDVKIGDVLKGETTNNKVLSFHRPELDGKLYSLNGGRYFVTEEHPFKTIDGWKAINPNKTEKNIGITVTALKVGDTLITDKGNVLLKIIVGKEAKDTTPLFNFVLDGDHTYYADGYLVHNKIACDTSGHYCPINQKCVDGSGLIVGLNSPNSSGMCGLCPGTCSTGYTASCGGQVTVCTSNTACPPTGACAGTVAGSPNMEDGTPGLYEGMDCGEAFSTQAQCQQGWPAHGCHWNPAGGGASI